MTVLWSDGRETLFAVDAKANFDRDRLLLTVNTGSAHYGWHWDHFAALLITPEDSVVGGKTCTISLGFANGEELELSVADFQAVELNQAKNIIQFKGKQVSAIINLDYLLNYQIRDPASVENK